MKGKTSMMFNYKYNFPEHTNNGLFDSQQNYNFFIDASGYTRLGTAEEFLTNYPYGNAICDKIPMGYKVLILMERETIVSSSGIRWHNECLYNLEMANNCYINKKVYGKYILIMDNGDRIRCAESPDIIGEWPDYETALSKAMEVAEKEQRDVLIAKLYSWDDWH
ncbi:MAG: hypothetical protein J6X66_15200 [Lachnospiraceae bacterium]|nr:hypothetical protein [Lachnospiraceae bacterium]